ncbi:hypothetical protein HN011_001037 [Eciton burchellii]|nr:hypothetical protein HN011_001037 [Eciton burchellii]
MQCAHRRLILLKNEKKQSRRSIMRLDFTRGSILTLTSLPDIVDPETDYKMDPRCHHSREIAASRLAFLLRSLRSGAPGNRGSRLLSRDAEFELGFSRGFARIDTEFAGVECVGFLARNLPGESVGRR